MRREMTWFAFGLAIILGVFAITIFKGPTENVSDIAMLESQQHYEEAQKAVSDNNLELALNHLDAIQERTPAWYESRELYWQVKTELNTYAKKEKD